MSELRKNWEKDQEAAKLLSKLKQERRGLESLAMDRRAREMGMTRQVLVTEILNETRDKVIRDCDEARIKNETWEEQERQRKEKQSQSDADYALTKRRQHVRETDPELQELNRKLQAQYINRTLESQILENHLTKIKNENREKINAAILKEPLHQNDDKINKAELVRKYKMRRDLQDQMIEKEMKKKREYEEFLLDRVKMDEVVKRIHEDEQAAYDAKMAGQQRMRTEMQMFEATRLVWRERHKEQVLAQDMKLREVSDAAEKEALFRKAEKQRKLDEKDQLALRMACEIYERESKIAQHETLVSELDALKIKDEQSKQRKAEFKTSLEERAVLRTTLLGQITEHKETLQKEAELDVALHDRLLADMAADARLDDMGKEKQRARRLKFNEEAKVLVNEKRAHRAKELIAMINEEKRLAANDAAENDFVERERIIMIKEHAAKLGSYFPKGVLKPSDIPHLGPALASQLGFKPEDE